MNEQIPAHFHRDAPQDAHQRRRHRAVLSLLRTLPPGRVLDYGFGWGDIAWAARTSHPDIVGVDVEQRRVDFARAQYAPIRFERCRPDGLDFPDASFDIVLSVVVLPFVPDDHAYLREIRRVLRPGGHLVLASKTSPPITRWWRRLSGRREQDRHPAPGIRHHDAGDAAALLEAHGFRILERRAFYDPPFEARKNPADLANGVLQLLGERLGLIAPAPYPLFLARRLDGGNATPP
jgi:ubiquinone/menaquinone biosynthesis C-methylase UbiE